MAELERTPPALWKRSCKIGLKLNDLAPRVDRHLIHNVRLPAYGPAKSMAQETTWELRRIADAAQLQKGACVTYA